MVRTKRFYEVYIPGTDYSKIEDTYYKLRRTEKDLENGIIKEYDIRAFNNPVALKICVMEGKWNLFKNLIRPVVIGDEVKYLVDPFSNEMYEFISGLYTSYEEAYHKEMAKAKEYGGEIMSFDEIKLSLVIIPEQEKKAIMDLMFNLDRRLVEKIKIKDVLARRISGWGHPIDTERDVIYYSELSNLYPSLELFNKNIRTVYNDTDGCYDDGVMPVKDVIRIDYTHLSAENKAYADTLITLGIATIINEGTYEGLNIEVTGDREESILTINDRMFDLISGFKKQDVLYEMVAPLEVYNLVMRYEDLLTKETKRLLKENPINMSDLVIIANDLGFDYVYADSVIWRNLESYNRHAKFKQEMQQKKLTIQ